MGLLDRLVQLPNQTPLNVQGRAQWIAQNNVRTRLFQLEVSGTVTQAVAGTQVFNEGSILGALRNVGVAQGSQDQMIFDARMLRHYAEWAAAAGLPHRRLTTAEVVAGAGVGIPLFETLILPMAAPRTASPSETRFKEQNPQNLLSVFVQQAAAAVIADGTLNVTNLAVRVVQVYDEDVSRLPVFVSFADFVEAPVNGPTANLRVDLRGSDFLLGLGFQQDTSLGEVGDIINSLAIIGDGGVSIIGPNQVPYDVLVRSMAYDSGGVSKAFDYALGGLTANVPAFNGTRRGFFYWNFCPDGRLSGLIPPNRIANLRAEINCQPTALAGATGSVVRVLRNWLRRDDAVCTPEIPADLLAGIAR